MEASAIGMSRGRLRWLGRCVSSCGVDNDNPKVVQFVVLEPSNGLWDKSNPLAGIDSQARSNSRTTTTVSVACTRRLLHHSHRPTPSDDRIIDPRPSIDSGGELLFPQASAQLRRALRRYGVNRQTSSLSMSEWVSHMFQSTTTSTL